MAFNIASPTNLDPVAEVLVRRVLGLRRNLAKHPHLRTLVENSYACYSHRGTYGTLNDRLEAATAFANKLEHYSWDYDTKQSVVRTLVLAPGLYGCEVTPYSITAMGLLYTAVAKAIGPYNHFSSNPMAFNIAAPSNLDPVAEVLVRRVMGLRRNLAKHPHLRTLVDNIYACYFHRGSYGTQVDPKLLGALAPAPPSHLPGLLALEVPCWPSLWAHRLIVTPIEGQVHGHECQSRHLRWEWGPARSPQCSIPACQALASPGLMQY